FLEVEGRAVAVLRDPAEVVEGPGLIALGGLAQPGAAFGRGLGNADATQQHGAPEVLRVRLAGLGGGLEGRQVRPRGRVRLAGVLLTTLRAGLLPDRKADVGVGVAPLGEPLDDLAPLRLVHRAVQSQYR